MNVKPGTIVLIFEEDLPEIDHNKFALCVSECLCFYFYLNTEPRKHAPEDQVPVMGQMEMPEVLDHTSYINISQLMEFSPSVAQKAIDAGKVWVAPQTVIDRVVAAVKKSRYLPPRLKEMVLHHLGQCK